MFASHIIDSYNAQIMTVATEIDLLEQRLAELRQQQAALETEKQAMQTLAAAGQSAIDQSRQFLALARNSQEMIAAFWDKMDEVRNEGVSIADLQSDDLAPENDSDPSITIEVAMVGNEVIEAKIVEKDDTIETKTEQVIVNLTNGNSQDDATVTVEDVTDDDSTRLNDLTVRQLKFIANKLKVATNGTKQSLIDRIKSESDGNGKLPSLIDAALKV